MERWRATGWSPTWSYLIGNIATVFSALQVFVWAWELLCGPGSCLGVLHLGRVWALRSPATSCPESCTETVFLGQLLFQNLC